MDPDYAYNLYLDAKRNGDNESANEIMADLKLWISRGGYKPIGWK